MPSRSEPGAAFARAAEGMVGTRFRLHGREPETGLDCVGLVGAALAAIGRPVDLPSGYCLRTDRHDGLPALASALGFATARGPAVAGDVWMSRAGPGQLHFLIVDTAARNVIEAHAGLRRVVATPLPLRDPILSRWRLARFDQGHELWQH